MVWKIRIKQDTHIFSNFRKTENSLDLFSPNDTLAGEADERDPS
jgi:hypothetical protein